MLPEQRWSVKASEYGETRDQNGEPGTAYRQRVGQEQKYIKTRGDVGPQLLAFDDARRGVVSGNLYVGLRWYEQVFYEKVS